jgi:hypothetical protein
MSNNLMKSINNRGEIYFAMTRLYKKKTKSPFKICVECFNEIKYNTYYCDVVTFIPSETVKIDINYYHLHKNCAKNIQEIPLRDIIHARKQNNI